ncbi:ABC transporter permease [Paracoccus sp. (in: a-proteobacteria)]|uniref:ABC transporter permease n=1 Tax=Paracoccus sp. TaxID=267 RepID=UPI00289679B9|nr:ABC transporter permease [Paracoccus sp. (in: a-proteobacteria)]
MWLELIRRERPSTALMLLVPLIAVALAALASAGLFALTGKPVGAALYALLIEPFMTRSAFSEVLLKMGPLLLIAQGLAIGFRAQIFNIGAEGQFILGAIFASALPVYFPESTSIWLWPAMMVMGAIGGGLWAGIAALWRVKTNANEILVTLMLGFIATQLLNYLLLGPWKDPMGFNFPQSVMFQYEAMLPTLISGTRVNISFLFALAATALAWIYVKRSFSGYQLMVGGLAPDAAGYAGFRESRAVWISLLAGGLAAGLAGAAEVAGPVGQLQRSISTGYGFAAIIVAYLGALNPLGMIFSAFLLAVIYIGGDNAMVSAGLPVASVRVFQGLVLIAYLAALTWIRYRVQWRRKGAKA